MTQRQPITCIRPNRIAVTSKIQIIPTYAVAEVVSTNTPVRITKTSLSRAMLNNGLRSQTETTSIGSTVSKYLEKIEASWVTDEIREYKSPPTSICQA